jgi:hypothetical protein
MERSSSTKKSIPTVLGNGFFLRGLVLGTVAAAIAAAYVLVSPARYEAFSTFVIPNLSTGQASISLASRDATPLTILQGVGASARMISALSAKSGRSGEEIRLGLHWDVNAEANQLTARYQDSDGRRAVQMVQDAASELRSLGSELRKELAGTLEAQLRAALKQREAGLAELEQSLVAAQKRLRTVPDATSPTGLTALGRLKDVELELGRTETALEVARKSAAARGETKNSVVLPVSSRTNAMTGPSWKQRVQQDEYELRVAETKFGPDSPEVLTQRRKLRETERQLTREMTDYLASVRQGLDPEIAALESKRQVLAWQRQTLATLAKIAPDEALDLERRVREIQAEADALARMKSQVDAARLDAEIDRATYVMLDSPQLRDRPVNKDLLVPVGIAFLVGFGISALLSLRPGKSTELADS